MSRSPRVEGYDHDLVGSMKDTAVPFDDELGIVWDLFSPERVECHLDVRPEHRQPTGIVHGGVYCSLVEAAGSSAAMATVIGDGKVAFGVQNSTSFHRPTGDGRLRAVATPVHRGRTQHVWRVEITRDDGVLAAHGELRVAIRELRPGAPG